MCVSYLVDAFHDRCTVQLVLIQQNRDQQVRDVREAGAHHLLGRIKPPYLFIPHHHAYKTTIVSPIPMQNEERSIMQIDSSHAPQAAAEGLHGGASRSAPSTR